MSMSARHYLSQVLLVVFAAVAAGCSCAAVKPTAPAIVPMAMTSAVAHARATAAAASPPMHAHTAPSVAVPARFQLPGVMRVHTGSSFADWQAQFPANTRRLMAAFNKRHFGVYLVSSPAQVAWMAEHGYPMPEELAAVQSMSDKDLLALAKQGNVKAAFLLGGRDRHEALGRISHYRASGKTREDFWMNDPLAHTIVTRDDVLAPLIDNSDSAFKGFLSAADAPAATDNQIAIEAQVIAGLNFANRLGDTRSTWLLDNYVGNDPQRKAIVEGVSAANVNFTKLLSKVGTDAACLVLFPATTMPYSDTPPH